MYVVVKTDADDPHAATYLPCMNQQEAIAYAATLVYELRDEFSPSDEPSRTTLRELLVLFKIGNYEEAIKLFNKEHHSILIEYNYHTDDGVNKLHSRDLPAISMNAGVELEELGGDSTPAHGTSLEFDEDE